MCTVFETSTLPVSSLHKHNTSFFHLQNTQTAGLAMRATLSVSDAKVVTSHRKHPACAAAWGIAGGAGNLTSLQRAKTLNETGVAVQIKNKIASVFTLRKPLILL